MFCQPARPNTDGRTHVTINGSRRSRHASIYGQTHGCRWSQVSQTPLGLLYLIHGPIHESRAVPIVGLVDGMYSNGPKSEVPESP